MPKATKQDFEKCPTVVLAAWCARVVDHPAHFTKLASAKALTLWKEWLSLQTPPELSLKDQERKEAQLLSVHKQMAAFLFEIL